MSWDKFNEERKKARKLEKALKDAGNSAQKLTKKSKNSNNDGLDANDMRNIETACKNAVKHKILFSIFVVITIVMLCTLPFANTLEPMVNNMLNKYYNVSASDNGNAYVSTISDVITNSKLKVHYLYVGQGDCIMVDLPDGKNMIIDSGTVHYDEEICNKVINYIDKVLLAEGEIIDYLVITHPDADHLYYLPEIFDNFEVATVYRSYTFYESNGKDSRSKLDSDGTIATKAEKQALEDKEREIVANLNSTFDYNITWGDASKVTTNIKNTEIMYKVISRIYTETYAGNTPTTMKFSIAGDKILGTDYSFTFYAPVTPSKIYSSWNNYSCVMVLDYNGTKIAFNGDAEKVEENEILANQDKLKLPDVDIMHMGHHGSRTSSQNEFVKAFSPEYAIISCGIDNDYNLPNQDTFDTLLNNGVDENHVFVTARNGDIVIGFDYVGVENGVSAATPDKLKIAYSGDKSYVEVGPIHIEWWYIVVGIIVLSGLLLLVILPAFIKMFKSIGKK